MVISDKDYYILKHIVKYCDMINDTILELGDSYDSFENSHTYQNACCMCVLQIGELTNKLSSDIKLENSEVLWNEFKTIRNMYAHGYEKMQPKIAWKTIKNRIPTLHQQCNDIIKQLENDNEIEL